MKIRARLSFNRSRTKHLTNCKTAAMTEKTKTSPAKQFYITIPVKRYVKRFLELNYGDPVYFHSDKADYNRLRLALHRSRRELERNRIPYLIEDLSCTYKTNITVLLSERDFYRDGWELTRNEIISLNSDWEKRAKSLMRSVVGVYRAMGLPVSVSIHKFQDKFYFDEDVWPYESIKRDFSRKGTVEKIDFDGEVFNKIEKIVVTNLFDFGTISSTYKNDYDNDK